MTEWRGYRLGEIATIEIGGTPPRGVSAYWADETEDGFPWVSIADLQSRIVSKTKERITAKGVRSSNVKPISKNSLIMSFKLSIGRAALAGVDLYSNEAIAAIVPKDNRVCSDFLYYILPPVAKNAVTDTAVKGATLNKASLSKLRLTIPEDFRTQKQIAGILQTVDQTIEKTEVLIGKYQQIKAGLMHDLFTRGIGPDGQLRPPREQAPELYQETSIGCIPKDWVTYRLSEACTAIIDCPHSTPIFTDGGAFAARTMHIKDGVFLDEIASTVSENEYLKRVSRAVPQPGDVIFTREAPVGEAFVIPAGMKICLGQRVMLIQPRASLLDSNFLVEQIYAGRLKSRISDLTAGTTNPHLNVADVRELLIPLPCFSEQQQMMELAGAISRKVQSERALLKKLHKKKSGLMHGLLSGEVPVQIETEDKSEAASV